MRLENKKQRYDGKACNGNWPHYHSQNCNERFQEIANAIADAMTMVTPKAML
jgi:hypothetical protein